MKNGKGLNSKKELSGNMNGKKGQMLILLKIIVLGLFFGYILHYFFDTTLSYAMGFIIGAYIATRF